MNGLEQILQKIEEESQAAAAQVISDAEKQSESALKQEKEKTNAETAKIIDKAKKHAIQMHENAQSGCEALIRKGVLKTKSDIVGEWIDMAMEEIAEMDDEEYFSTMFNLILSHSDDKSGILLLNKKDKERMPANYIKMLNDALNGNSELTLAQEDADIDNGCIIRYGGIEENCTFSALLEEKSDEIKDRLFALVNAEV